MKIFLSRAITVLLLALMSLTAFGQDKIILPVDEYDPQVIGQEKENANLKWDLLKLNSDELTSYSITTDDKGNKIIKAVAEASAGGLVYDISIDPKEYPIIEWRWKVDNVLSEGNLRPLEFISPLITINEILAWATE